MTIDIHTFPATFTAIQSILDERCRQERKWGTQSHPAHIWLAILGEEYGELCEASLQYELPHLHNPSGEYDLPAAQLKAALRKEAVQVAAVAVAMIESIDRAEDDTDG